MKHRGTRILVNQVEAAPHFPQPFSLSPQENSRNRVGKSAPNLKSSSQNGLWGNWQDPNHPPSHPPREPELTECVCI